MLSFNAYRVMMLTLYAIQYFLFRFKEELTYICTFIDISFFSIDELSYRRLPPDYYEIIYVVYIYVVYSTVKVRCLFVSMRNIIIDRFITLARSKSKKYFLYIL